MTKQEIFEQLKKIQNNSYCKYSNYKVSSIVKTELGFFNGVNVENAAYPLSVCAERTAIGNAISNGSKQIIELYLLTQNSGDKFGTPCGGCRQVILEFMDKDSKIYIFNMDGQYKEYTVEQLIPYAWDVSMLK